MRNCRRSLLAVLGFSIVLPGQAGVTTGGEVYSGDKPVSGVEVLMVREDYANLPAAARCILPPPLVPVAKTRSKDGGRFGFRVPPGKRVAFFARQGDRMSRVSSPQRAGSFVRLQLRPGRVLSGVVRRRARGPGVAGHPLTLFFPAGNTHRFGLFLQIQTDAQGVYRAHIPVGNWSRVLIAAPGLFEGRDVHDQLVHDFVLDPTPEWSRGRVVGADGKAVANCLVVDDQEPRRSVRTGPDGGFAMRAPRLHLTHATIPGGHIASALLRGFRPPPGGTEPVFRLSADHGLTLPMAFTDGAGKPLAGRRVLVVALTRFVDYPLVRSEVFPRLWQTDGQGRVDLGIPTACRYLSVFVETPHGFTWVFRGAPKETEALQTRVLRSTGAIAGRTLLATGEPFAAARVSLLRMPDDGSNEFDFDRRVGRMPIAVERRSDAAGRFGFDCLQPGVYRLVVWGDSCFPLSRIVRVGTTSQDLVIRYPKRSTFRGQLVDALGSPLAGVKLLTTQVPQDLSLLRGWLNRCFGEMESVGGWMGGAVVRSRTDAKGRFQLFGGRPLGTVVMATRASGASKEFVLAPSQRDERLVWKRD